MNGEKGVPLYRLRLRMLEFFGCWAAAARLRWRQRNALQSHDCLCGKPGVHVRTTPITHEGKDLGGPEHWSCEEHLTVPLTTPWEVASDGTATPMNQDSDGAWMGNPGIIPLLPAGESVEFAIPVNTPEER